MNKKFIRDNLIPIKEIINEKNFLSKPSWIKKKFPHDDNNIKNLKKIISNNNLHTVCQEASCPNITECFNNGTATFMILGKICTRNCPFCNVKHGRPLKPDIEEPKKLAKTVYDMQLNYVVITSVNRDDLYDGGAKHFSDCISAIKSKNINIRIEILVPDFRGCMTKAVKIISSNPPDIFNHNLESIPRLYKNVRPGANYNRSLKLLSEFKHNNPNVPTKSGLMLGLGESKEEIIDVLIDLHKCGVTMITIGQYLQPSKFHLPVKRYVSLKEFNDIKIEALKIGFSYVACGPFIRSSYNAEMQANGINI